MKILITGKSGQLGWELLHALGPLGTVVAICRSELNLEDTEQIRTRIREIAPDVIVNAAAYTDVEKAELEPERANAINGIAPGILAQEARRRGALLIHISTDYVFNGACQRPYEEDDPVGPVNAYGASKALGEHTVITSDPQALIIRTSWLYSARGRNFLLFLLDRIRRHEPLEIVADQIGAPTYAAEVAHAIAKMLAQFRDRSGESGLQRIQRGGIYHLSAAGYTSRLDFALAVRESARALAWGDAVITGVPSSALRTAARRPLNSRLSNRKFFETFGIALPDWRVGLRRCFDELVALKTGTRPEPV